MFGYISATNAEKVNVLRNRKTKNKNKKILATCNKRPFWDNLKNKLHVYKYFGLVK